MEINKKIIVGLFIVGIFLVGGFLILYNQKYPKGHEEESFSITEFFSKLGGGITGFAVITHNTSSNWTGTFVNTTKIGDDYNWLDYNINSFINADNLMLSIDNKILT